MTDIFDTETIEHLGITVRIDYCYDYDAGKPWENSCGHGVIREAYSYYDKPEKKPGEVLIHSGRGNYWVYDVQETTKIAKGDAWGLSNPPAGLTKKQITALAVKKDLDFIRGWINDDWYYAGIVCTVLDSDGEETSEEDSCWGFETFNDYHETAGREMARSLAETVHTAKLKKWRSALTEARARRYWASRDVLTVGA